MVSVCAVTPGGNAVGLLGGSRCFRHQGSKEGGVMPEVGHAGASTRAGRWPGHLGTQPGWLWGESACCPHTGRVSGEQPPGPTAVRPTGRGPQGTAGLGQWVSWEHLRDKREEAQGLPSEQLCLLRWRGLVSGCGWGHSGTSTNRGGGDLPPHHSLCPGPSGVSLSLPHLSMADSRPWCHNTERKLP